MFSKYFKFKIKTENFINNAKQIISDLEGKRVVVCGDYKEFLALNKKYRFKKHFHIAAFSVTNNHEKIKKSPFKMVKFEDIPKMEFDAIVVTSEEGDVVLNKIKYGLLLDKADVRLLFIETVKDARENLSYLLKYKFDKTFPKLKKRLKNKTCLLYGCGIFFDVISQYFDIKSLNIIGVADIKFRDINFSKEYKGYPVYKPEQIVKLNPDYVVTTTKQIVKVWEYLYFENIEKTKIKIVPIYKKRLLSILHEFADS